MTPEQLNSFQIAFSERVQAPTIACHCGVTYYNRCDSHAFSLDTLNGLEDVPGTKFTTKPINVVNFSPDKFASCCDCWHPIATKYAQWILINKLSIMQFIQSEGIRENMMPSLES